MKLYDEHALRVAICNAERELIYIGEWLDNNDLNALCYDASEILGRFAALLAKVEKYL